MNIEPQPTGPSGPSQQLGAVPGTAAAVPGYDGFESGSIDGEFASSAEADIAPRDDYDVELSEDILTAARVAHAYGPVRGGYVTTHEAENMGYVGGLCYWPC